MGRGAARLGPLLCMTLAGCQALVPEIFKEDDCPIGGDRPLTAVFETSEGTVSFDEGQIRLSAAGDKPDCYTGISFTLRGDDESSACGLRIEASSVPEGLGAEWPISYLTFACSAPTSLDDSYKWDRMSEGGSIRILRPENLPLRLDDGYGCLREGIEIHLNARMVLAGPQLNPDSVKEFWFPEQTYFMDDPLPVIEAFDCPF